MKTMEQLRQGLGQAWQSLAEGWQQLSERARDALTRFNPITRSGSEVETSDELVERQASRWALLPAQVHEDDSEVVVRLEVPGMAADQFDIQVHDDVLQVRGEKRVQREKRSGRYYLMECAYGSFERAISLPVPVEGERAKAKYRRGVLTISLPKHSLARSRRIEVQAG